MELERPRGWMEERVCCFRCRCLGIPINAGVVVAHGHRVARYGGILNSDDAGFHGKSYLDIVDLPAKRPSMMWESGDVGSGYPVFNAAFSADGGVALYDALDWSHQPRSELAVVTFHEGGDATVTALEKMEDWGMALAVSADGKRGASYMNQSTSVGVWDLGAGRALGKLDVGVPVSVLAMDSAGKRVVVGTMKPGKKSVQVWDVASGKDIFDCVGHTGGIISAAISADDAVVATADSDGTIWMWSLVTGKALARLECGGGRIDALAFSADGRRLAAATDEAIAGHEAWDRAIRLTLWDVGTAGRLATLEKHGLPVRSVAFSEDGGQLVTYGGVSVEHWEIPGDLPEEARGRTRPRWRRRSRWMEKWRGLISNGGYRSLFRWTGSAWRWVARRGSVPGRSRAGRWRSRLQRRLTFAC